MRSEWWVVALLFSGCLEQVDLNPFIDGGAKPGGSCQPPETLLTCPIIEHAPRAFSTSTDLRSSLVRRWAFCGGQRRATGRGKLGTFFGGDGIEFYEEAGALRFAFLKDTTGTYGRQPDPWAGTVRIETAGSVSTVVLIADDGVETPWTVLRFDEPDVLRNITFDSWDFIPLD